MAGHLPLPRREALLLELFTREMVERLVEKGIAAVRPAIEEAALKAVEELKPAVRGQFDVMAGETVIQLILNGERK